MTQNFYANRPLAFSLVLSIAIATTEVPLWISVFAFTFLVWRFLYEKFGVYKLSTKITPIFGVLVFVLVYMQYKTILGQEESTTVLLGLASLSVLNYRSERDGLFLVLLGFLLVVIKSVFSLDFVWTVPALISFFGLWISLFRHSRLNKFKYLFSMALKSVPIFLILFVYCPRLVIFQSKKSQKVYAQSGFSEDLDPWRVSEMNLQNQIVFRADFKNNFMNTDELYWRGAVLSVSNGFSWQKGSVEKVHPMAGDEADQGSLEYRIIVEPLNLKNIFVLETPVSIRSSSSPIVQLQSNTYALNELQTQQVQFEAISAFGRRDIDDEDPTTLKKYINISGELPPKSRVLVDEIKAKKLSVQERIEWLKKFFSEKGFIYTLKPGLYKNNIDEFLFERKKGFCEHFAAAFGTLARALGIPSRVILGYQGGLYNSLGNFWKISQKDAHAWVEVGIDGRWVRVDPTGLVSPLRLSMGGESYFSLSEDEQILYSKDKSWRKPNDFVSYFDEIKSAVENLNYYWTLLLLNYDLQAQLEYLKALKANSVILGLVAFSLLVLLVYSRKRSRSINRYRHEMHRFFDQIEAWATKQGFHPDVQQTPLQILKVLGDRFPALKATLQQVEIEYVRAAYQNQQTCVPIAHLEKEWRKAIRQLKKSS